LLKFFQVHASSLTPIPSFVPLVSCLCIQFRAFAYMPWDDYEKMREISLGSFGRSFLVRRQADKKLLAMKEYNFSSLTQLERRDALEDIQVLSCTKHPFLIRYCEKFIHDRHMCMVADETDGVTLWSFAKLCSRQRSVIPESQVLRWFCQVCLAVKYLHERPQPILHRDIKLQNIFVVKQNLIDVGSAKLFVEFGTARILDTPGSLVQGHVGTHYCQSPEICSRLPYGTASDVWSLGCILYELCTAHMSWEAEDIPDHIENLLIAPFSMISGSHSSDLGNIASVLLAHEPNERPSVATLLKTGILQSEIRRMLEDRNRGGGNRSEPNKQEDVPSRGLERRSDIENDPRQMACPPKAGKSYIPRTARSASPQTAQFQKCYESPRTSMPCTRPLAEHNPRMPRSARSPSPHEVAKLLIRPQVLDSPRRHCGDYSSPVPSKYDDSGIERARDQQRRMQEAAAVLLTDL